VTPGKSSVFASISYLQNGNNNITHHRLMWS
jgi:hypothetical protein